MNATREVIFNIMRNKPTWKPYEIVQELQAIGIFISESTITRQFRRWNKWVIAIEPVDRSVSRAWAYKLIGA